VRKAQRTIDDVSLLAVMRIRRDRGRRARSLASTLAAVLLLWRALCSGELFGALFVAGAGRDAVVHIGTTNQPMRSLFFFTLGLVLYLALAVLAIFRGAF